MQLTLLKGKIHRARVTECNLHYAGSIGIDEDLMAAANILPYERVSVANVTNGARFDTYVLPAPKGSGAIAIYGAAAHLAKLGDIIIIFAWANMDEKEAQGFKPAICLVDENNKIKF
ncbi:aspartate 1-decarboxylase [bacterium]|jgi:aspartate 1-decarboxylase|nr:aspartate 1-decarboxylase [bacterium]